MPLQVATKHNGRSVRARRGMVSTFNFGDSSGKTRATKLKEPSFAPGIERHASFQQWSPWHIDIHWEQAVPSEKGVPDHPTKPMSLPSNKRQLHICHVRFLPQPRRRSQRSVLIVSYKSVARKVNTPEHIHSIIDCYTRGLCNGDTGACCSDSGSAAISTNQGRLQQGPRRPETGHKVHSGPYVSINFYFISSRVLSPHVWQFILYVLNALSALVTTHSSLVFTSLEASVFYLTVFNLSSLVFFLVCQMGSAPEQRVVEQAKRQATGQRCSLTTITRMESRRSSGPPASKVGLGI